MSTPPPPPTIPASKPSPKLLLVNKTGSLKRKEPTPQDVKEKKLEVRLIKKVKQEMADLQLIKKANRERFEKISDDCSKSSGRTIFTPTDPRPFMVEDNSTPTIRVGEFVSVESDFSPGMNRESGTGFIAEIMETESHEMFASVKYELDQKVRKQIPLNAMTVVDYHVIFSNEKKGKRKATLQKSLPEPEKLDFSTVGKSKIDVLRAVLKEGAGKKKKKGWHRRELKLNIEYENRERKREPHWNDLEISQFLYEIDLLKTYLDTSKANKYFETKRNGKIKKRRTKVNPDTMGFLLFAWGTSASSISRFREKMYANAKARGVTGMTALCSNVIALQEVKNESRGVIDCFESARKLFTAEYLFVRAQVLKKRDRETVLELDSKEVEKIAKLAYQNLSLPEKEWWEATARAHVSRQPRIASIIKSLVRKNSAIIYHGIANGIQNWVSAPTIQRWITSREGYRLYSEKVIPLLSPTQKEKHLTFAKHLRNNWGRGKGKYLLIHYDEKWFWGMLMRNTAKSFEDVERQVMKIYHKCHISKTMGIAVVGFAFEDSLENGGIALKMLFHRAQSAKVAQRLTKNKAGKKLREKGDIYFVDCNVTGSSDGTAKDPKFALLDYFKHAVFPEIEQLTKPGGRFFGYTPVIQGDNAGPHTDAKFGKFVRDHCKSKGWLWEPQGPQMPHINVLDLAVFPAMSRRHCHLSRSLHGTKVLKEDDIWNVAVEVWKDLPSSKVANAFVLAGRVADKIIASKGSNEFLSGVKGSITSGVRGDFVELDDGIMRQDGGQVEFKEEKEDKKQMIWPKSEEKDDAKTCISL